jgi:homocysteine S-methyltransferase
MTHSRADLPQSRGQLMLTDGGLETTLVFHDGVDLPDFASFPLHTSDDGRARLDHYFRTYADIAARNGTGIVLETATWRASADWGARLGYDAAALAEVNRAAVTLVADLRSDYEPATPIVVSGNLGPRGDGYQVGQAMTADEAEAYHRPQIAALASGGADLITVLTMTYPEEAIGIARAAAAEGMPVVVSFTIETDGRIPSGATLADAITAVEAATDGYPLHYGINCAHPDHIEHALVDDGDWVRRIGLLRANASRLSHAELDEATELDDGDPVELGAQYADLRRRFPHLVVLGGCCGTDDRHVGAIASACTSG